MKEIFRAIDNAYSALDDCISKIVKSRLDKDRESEERALYKLEIDTNGVLQDLSYIKRQLQKRDWIKVEDRLPEEGQLCLVRDKLGRYMCGVYQEIDFLHSNSKQWGILSGASYTLLKDITHWLPIVPPKED